MSGHVFSRRVSHSTNRATRANIFFLWLFGSCTPFLLQKIFILKQFIQLGMPKSNVLGNLVRARICVVAVVTFLNESVRRASFKHI